MGEYLRSALNTISANWSSAEGINGQSEIESEMIGTSIELKGQRLRFERVISVGGFGYVFRMKDVQTQEQFALKRLIAADKEAQQDVLNEIHILTKLQTHAHIMRFICSTQSPPNGNIFYILTEFCAGGSVANLCLPITNTKQLNRILYQTSNAILHMHLLHIVHRDIKIENILFDSKGFVKLCDFGSATEKSYHPNQDWTSMQRSLIEDEYCRKTTPMYRPPEILDLYLNYSIDKPMDIWAFGCILYLMKFGQHPFEDSAKLRIINCKYQIPVGTSTNDVHVQLIKSCIQINPDDRIRVEEIIEILEKNFVDLIAPCVRPKQSSPIAGAPPFGHSSSSSSSSPAPGQPGSAQSVSQAFSGFTKYLKDTSSKVMQTVQQSIAMRQDLDMSYLTSRVIAMSYPAEGLESAYRNHIDDVKAYLESRKSPYVVVNVSGRSYGSSKFGHNVKLIDGGNSWKEVYRLPSLIEILYICDQVSNWVTEQERRRLLVFHCSDGKVNSAFIISAFLLYIGLFKDHKTSNNLFSVQRTPITFGPAQRRYLDYITNFNSKNKVDLFDTMPKLVRIRSIVMNGIPLFTKNRDGCRPTIEVYTNGDTRLYSTANEYEDLRVYNRTTDSKVQWKDLNLMCNSNADLCIVISHARSGLGARVLQANKMNTMRICSVQFNLAIERQAHVGNSGNVQTIRFETIQLDGIDTIDRYPREFQIQIELEYTSSDSKHGRPSEQLSGTICDPILLFENHLEFEDCKDTFNCQRPAYLINGALPKHNLVHPPPSEPFTESPEDSSSEEKPTEFLFDGKPNAKNLEDDLLNLNLNSPVKAKTSPQISSLEEDLFGNFESKNVASNLDLLNDIIGAGDKEASIKVKGNENSQEPASSNGNSNVDLLEEIFSISSASTTNKPKPDLIHEKVRPDVPLLQTSSIPHTPTVGGGGGGGSGAGGIGGQVHRNISTPNLLGFDPFDQLGAFATSTSSKNGVNSSPPSDDLLKPQKAQNPPKSPPFSSSNKPDPTNFQGMPRVSSYSAFGSASSSAFKPDYNRSYFNENKPNSNGTGISGKVNNNAFDDLLKGFTKNTPTDWSSAQQPKSMAQMKKEEMLRDGTINPLMLKVNEWKENKKRNIRALLGSLHQVVWDDCNWIAIGMHQLINPTDVKKMYRKACLSIHPDKLVGSEHEELAKLIFIELNDAWNEFEKQRT